MTGHLLLLRMAVMRLLRFRLQTALLATGIVVSMCATVLVSMALANVRDRFTQYLDRLYPSDTIMLASDFSPSAQGREGGVRLKVTDVQSVLAATTQIVDWDPLVYGGEMIVKLGSGVVRAVLVGSSDREPQVRGRSVILGEYFSAADVRAHAKVCVIGKTIAAVLFPGQSPLGEQLGIDGVQLRVVGVLEEVGLDPHGADEDALIEVPYTTLMDNLLKVDFLTSVTFELDDRRHTPLVVQQVSDTMREVHSNRGIGSSPGYWIVTPDGVQRSLDQAFRTIETYVGIVAASGYALSGAIIAVVMLIGVRARTGEIGLRKAVGASRGDIHRQILFEALILATFSVLLGLLLARLLILVSANMLLENFGLVMKRVPLGALGATLAGAFGTAILGALLPARRAAALDPVVALGQS